MSGAGLEMLSGPVRRGFVAFEFAAHILFGMPDPTKETPQKSTGSFANFLASFAGRLQSDLWDDSALMDDVATLSYEQALRTTRRSGTPEIRDDSAFKYEDHASAKSLVNPSASASRSKKQRGASITIRVTAEEQAQLQQRAREAELSVSAYLRSCIFEAESLRSQVKEALAKMQSPQADAVDPPESRLKRFLPVWFRRNTSRADA